MDRTRISRRHFLKFATGAAGTALLAACGAQAPAAPAGEAPTAAPAGATEAPAAAAPTSAPEVNTQQVKDITLRQIGTGVSQYNEIAEQAKKDLGFSVTFRVLSSTETVQIGITQPDQYDVGDFEIWMTKLVYPSGNIQPLETTKLTEWDKIVPIFKNGKMTPDQVIAQGTAPHTVMFVDSKDSTVFAKEETGFATCIPTQYNADTLGYRPDLVGRKIESWAELFNPEFKGKTAILDIPSIGIMDAAMVVEAAGIMKFADKGNMTKEELDKLTAILIEQKKAGQFRAFWKTFDESINLMASGEVVIQSMWSPAVTQVKAKGIECIYAPLKEGYRAWASGLALSRNLSGIQLDAGYEYLNWWNSGWAGGFIGRQGYYSAVPENAKKFMSPAEGDFWYEGKPAAEDMIDPFGKKLEPKGAVRDGGSFMDRMGKISCWNSVMDEQEYMVSKWNEFIAA